MDVSDILQLTSQALVLVLILSLPPILAASIVGTLVSLLQALTQVQEQTLSFVIKLIAVIISLFATASWLGAELYQFSMLVFDQIANVQ